MKRKSGDRTVTVEDFYRECLRAAKLPLGKVEGKDPLGSSQGPTKENYHPRAGANSFLQ